MSSVGFSTGSLYRTSLSLSERIALFHSLGAKAIELSFATPNELFQYSLSSEDIETIKKFQYVSIHAPFKEVRYRCDQETRNLLGKLNLLRQIIPVSGVVIHPNNIAYFPLLERSGLPFLIENMDGRKIFGNTPEDFAQFKEDCDFGFVLDVQHAYEHDPTMNLAKELVEVMGDRLKEMHVSGCRNDEIHFPTYRSENRKAISKILERRIPVPKILEGLVSQPAKTTIRREMRYVQKYEL